MSRPTLLARSKRAYAFTARAGGRLLDRAGLLPDVPPSADRRWRHWLYSLPLIRDPRALVELDVPWWTYQAIDAVDVWLAARERPIRVFEYGAGASTAWLAARCDEVHSVEHDPSFARLLAPLLAGRPGVDLALVEVPRSGRPLVGSEKEGQRDREFTGYVATIDRVGGEFDLVVVDGRVRAACLRAALLRLKADGMVVFDNSRRRRYRSAIEAAGLHEQVLRGLTPTLPYPEQTSLLRPARSSG